MSLVVSTSAVDCLERLFFEMTYYVSSGTLTYTHSLKWSDFVRNVDVRATMPRRSYLSASLPGFWSDNSYTSYLIFLPVIFTTLLPSRVIGRDHQLPAISINKSCVSVLLKHFSSYVWKSHAVTVLCSATVSYTHLTLPTIYSV